ADMSIVVIGDANVDLEIRLPAGSHPESHANPDPELFSGGSAANTAAALALLGEDCSFVGTVGDDSFGRQAVLGLEAAGVDVGQTQISADEPTVAVLVVVPQDGDRLIYVWPPSGGAHGALTPPMVIDAVQGASWLHVSGICLRTSPSREALLAGMSAARSAGVPVSFDLNLRLENWGWDGGFRETVMEAVELCDVLLGAGSAEIGALAGDDDPVRAAESLASDGRVVVARLGAEGAIAWSEAGLISEPGFEVPVVDTVGAGDAFDAGFISARLRGFDLTESLRWGNAVAGLAITAPGARSIPSADEVARLVATADG
ncbi:MAG: carbohydrate kinase family protein, partial [Acidimicrobiia bacterium]